MFQVGWASVISQLPHVALRWKWVWYLADFNTALPCQNKLWETVEVNACIYFSWYRICLGFLSHFLSKMENICQKLSISGNTQQGSAWMKKDIRYNR